jgi:hypothetical protein
LKEIQFILKNKVIKDDLGNLSFSYNIKGEQLKAKDKSYLRKQQWIP